MITETKMTAKERYAMLFREELEAHPGVPPSRTRIAAGMGWKTSNHSGESPQWRRDLMEEAGFVMWLGRWREVGFVMPARRSLEEIEKWLTA